MEISSPCRAVRLVIEALGLEINYKSVNLINGDHLTDEYRELNPQQTIPLLIDDNYKLSESRAIMAYLVDQYGGEENQRLYPTNSKTRALINARLQFDGGVLYPSVKNCYYGMLFRGQDDIEEVKENKLKEAFKVVDNFLEGHDYLAGRSLTIADLAIIATVTTAETVGFNLDDYKNVTEWVDRVKTCAPGYRVANGESVELLKNYMPHPTPQDNNNSDDNDNND
ncbi:GSCOCT00014110001.2-RA-CDS [Cotesia congregata]|uniref:Glutathione S-transferase Delta 3 n=1 Tax=Cotesia congregata TaxID=51543 RepID=A0A8J2EBW7_COTCN|nr:GSCOCT00014110001.2-RA-CDS [Cotesia congregata]CAG5076140.1 glutathione S-transferase Delta 3 [Cotesia congregata]